MQEGVKAEEVDIIPYDLTLGYDKWTYRKDISFHGAFGLSADGSQTMSLSPYFPRNSKTKFLRASTRLAMSVSTRPINPLAGMAISHAVVHLNLRDQYLPYKKVIADVILDKTPRFKTVINKIDNVGTESAYRTFSYEVLAGPDDLNVEVKENDCVFHFDYAKVYWNSKLEPEHTRLVRKFQPGEVVCDVMAGIGPFAVPAGKKGVFVYANDMNPESHKYLKESIQRNKV